MKIVNVLFALTRGGLEQVFLDYGRALALEGHEVHMVCQPDCPYLAELRAMPVTVSLVANTGEWDFRCLFALNQLLIKLGPDLIIGHGNRALSMLKPVLPIVKSPAPVFGVAQNYKLKRFARLDGAFASTRELRTLLQTEHGLKSVYHVPNMVSLPTDAIVRPHWSAPPVIGTLGRFVTKKGFAPWLEALGILKAEGIAFKAILGGDGELAVELKALAASLGIADRVTFCGWVESKGDFYNAIDIFCLPSLHEPFGIVLLESMSYQLPMVSTDTEGPMDFLHDGVDSLIVPKNDPAAMAAALKRLIEDRQLADTIGVNAFVSVRDGFTHQAAGVKMTAALKAFLPEAVA
jgi:glycosyltransferase involved in cell wall biosynthesis